MGEIKERACEKLNVITLDFPLWIPPTDVYKSTREKESATADGLKDLSHPQTCGDFLGSECKYAWLSHERRLIVIDVRYGKCISTWNFPNKITSVCTFPMEPGQVPLLLIGTDNNAMSVKDSMGYLYVCDCNTSIILTKIQVPAGIEKACVVHGGTEWEDYNKKRPDTVLPGNTGLIFAALRNLQHVVIDVNRMVWQTALQDTKVYSATLDFVNIPSMSASSSNKRKLVYSAYDLMDRKIEQYLGFDKKAFESTPLGQQTLCTSLHSSTKTGCLISGCMGRVLIWANDGSIRWMSPTFDECSFVSQITLLESARNPLPYLCIATQGKLPNSSSTIRMYTLQFGQRRVDKSSFVYIDLKSEPSLAFELKLQPGERVCSLMPVERELSRKYARDHDTLRGEESLLLIGSDERLRLFDLNRWFEEQMPRTMAECNDPNSLQAVYRIERTESSSRESVVAHCYAPSSLREFYARMPQSREKNTYPSTFSVEWVVLSSHSITHCLARGSQIELLQMDIAAGPTVLVEPEEIYRRCLESGLVPFDSVAQIFNFNSDESKQRELLFSVFLEQRWTDFLVRCAFEWSDGKTEDLLVELLRWGVQRAEDLQIVAEKACEPLFARSGDSDIEQIDVRTLRLCAEQFESLGVVASRFAHPDLEKRRRSLERVARYLQVLMWFHDANLLPDRGGRYSTEKLAAFCTAKRESEKPGEEVLFIDQLVRRKLLPLRDMWKAETQLGIPGTLEGRYPPPSWQALLKSFVIDCSGDDTQEYENIDNSREEQYKHCLVMYSLMDLTESHPQAHPYRQLVARYADAFHVSRNVSEIIRAFWLLDHEDYEGFCKVISRQLLCFESFEDWEFYFGLQTLLRNDKQSLALAYVTEFNEQLVSERGRDETGIDRSISISSFDNSQATLDETFLSLDGNSSLDDCALGLFRVAESTPCGSFRLEDHRTEPERKEETSLEGIKNMLSEILQHLQVQSLTHASECPSSVKTPSIDNNSSNMLDRDSGLGHSQDSHAFGESSMSLQSICKASSSSVRVAESEKPSETPKAPITADKIPVVVLTRIDTTKSTLKSRGSSKVADDVAEVTGTTRARPITREDQTPEKPTGTSKMRASSTRDTAANATTRTSRASAAKENCATASDTSERAKGKRGGSVAKNVQQAGASTMLLGPAANTRSRSRSPMQSAPEQLVKTQKVPVVKVTPEEKPKISEVVSEERGRRRGASVDVEANKRVTRSASAKAREVVAEDAAVAKTARKRCTSAIEDSREEKEKGKSISPGTRSRKASGKS